MKFPHNPVTMAGELTVVLFCACALLLLLLMGGCVAKRPPTPPPVMPPLTQATPVEDPAPAVVQPPSHAEFLDSLPPEIQQAMEHYEKTGTAPLIHKKGASFVTFPYGLSQPVVYCRHLELCDIELQEGEEVLDLAAGDQERWVLSPLRSGPVERRITHILAKPIDWQGAAGAMGKMETTLVVGTNRRTYRIRLVSRPKGAIVNVRFYYPQEFVQRINDDHAAAYKAQQPVVAEFPSVSLDQLDDRYHIQGDAAWKPTWVANDGARTYVKLGQGTETGTPALFVSNGNGQAELVNYRIKGGYVIADGVPAVLSLVSGAGKEKRTVTITREEH